MLLIITYVLITSPCAAVAFAGPTGSFYCAYSRPFLSASLWIRVSIHLNCALSTRTRMIFVFVMLFCYYARRRFVAICFTALINWYVLSLFFSVTAAAAVAWWILRRWKNGVEEARWDVWLQAEQGVCAIFLLHSAMLEISGSLTRR